MFQIREQLFPFERLTREPGHHFFGYYDLAAFSQDGLAHLAHRVAFMDRMPTPQDPCELGAIDIASRRFVPFATTYTWNWQQGAFLQWHPVLPYTVLYNSFAGGHYRGVVHNLMGGERTLLSKPVAAVDPLGCHTLSVHFSRMYDFRPGYGYNQLPDPRAAVAHPDDEGIFLTDLKAGTSRLILSLKQLRAFFKSRPELDRVKLMVNHINFNTDGSRFVFLLRTMPMPGDTAPLDWKTATLTANTDGSDLYLLNDWGMASHYVWKDAEHLLMFADGGGRGKSLYLYKDRSSQVEAVDPLFFTFDGHCTYSKDGRFILYDNYPDNEGLRTLFLYELAVKRAHKLAVLHHGRVDGLPSVDSRCDLHPRFDGGGKCISFDSIHEGHRHIYLMDVGKLTQA